MKKMIALLLALLLPLTALAFDSEELLRTPSSYHYEQFGTADTVVRMENQPWQGEMDFTEVYDDGELYVYIDYLHLANLDVTLLRLTAAITVYEPLQANQVRFTVGGKTYTFDLPCEQSEYDGVYMEDYMTCLTDASLPLLQAIARQKTDDPIEVAFLSGGEVMLTGRVILPGQEVADLFDRYVDLGGKQQNLKDWDGKYPCKVEKAQ